MEYTNKELQEVYGKLKDVAESEFGNTKDEELVSLHKQVFNWKESYINLNYSMVLDLMKVIEKEMAQRFTELSF